MPKHLRDPLDLFQAVLVSLIWTWWWTDTVIQQVNHMVWHYAGLSYNILWLNVRIYQNKKNKQKHYYTYSAHYTLHTACIQADKLCQRETLWDGMKLSWCELLPHPSESLSESEEKLGGRGSVLSCTSLLIRRLSSASCSSRSSFCRRWK